MATKPSRRACLFLLSGAVLILAGLISGPAAALGGFLDRPADPAHAWDSQVRDHTRDLMDSGRTVFRYDTFGSEAFFGTTIGLHQAIEGARFPGGTGGGLSPKTALSVGLKVDADALPPAVVKAVQAGQVDLNDPAVTLTLLQLGAVVGVEGVFNDPSDTSKGLKAVGITCALCHSTVDDSFAPGIGHRLDGWANQDLNVGAIVALAPNLQPVADLLNRGLPPSGQVDVPTVRKVLQSWGPGRFDAELFMDGKAFGPGGSNASTLIPDAFGLAGVNAHTWTGNWGTVTYWNAFVSNLEMHGSPGTFFDPRLDDKQKFPVAAANGFGHVAAPPGVDRISPKLGALQFYQLSLPTPQPQPGKDFDLAAANRGRVLFNTKAQCATCHVPPMFSEPGWNLHTPAEIGLDDASGRFQADRSPDGKYRTTPLAGRLFKRTRGFFHDGRFATLLDVVNHFDAFQKLGLTEDDKRDLVEYLKSI
jgi:mono/diheme cytochrome c family protein